MSNCKKTMGGKDTLDRIHYDFWHLSSICSFLDEQEAWSKFNSEKLFIGALDT